VSLQIQSDDSVVLTGPRINCLCRSDTGGANAKQHAFKLVSPQKSVTFIAETKASKDGWIQALRVQIQKQQNRRTQIMKSRFSFSQTLITFVVSGDWYMTATDFVNGASLECFCMWLTDGPGVCSIAQSLVITLQTAVMACRKIRWLVWRTQPRSYPCHLKRWRTAISRYIFV